MDYVEGETYTFPDGTVYTPVNMDANPLAFADGLVETAMKLQDYDSVKDRILFRLVNLELNEEYLKNLVYVPLLDLAVCFYIIVGDENEIGTIQLNKAIFSFWNITVEEVYQKAMENTPVLMPYKFRSMAEIFEVASDADEFSQYMNPPEYKESNLWILGNEKQMFGASAILYHGVMKEVAKIMNVEDIVILPSSVHECILLPLLKDYDFNYLRELISFVNNTQIEPEERLSYSVYRYSLESDEISILVE